MLKEAVEDLEWAATGGASTQRGTCQLRLGRQPRSLLLRAAGTGSLEVQLKINRFLFFKNHFLPPPPEALSCHTGSTQPSKMSGASHREARA